MVERESTLTDVESPWAISSKGDTARLPCLVIIWSAEQPERVGEVAFVPEGGATRMLGRGRQQPSNDEARLLFSSQRPGAGRGGGLIRGAQISRRQTLFSLQGDAIAFRNVGACPLRVNGFGATEGLVGPGDTVTLKDQLVLLCMERAVTMPGVQSFPMAYKSGFGGPDDFGIVGESPAAWKLRDDIAFVARAGGHALILGDSGVGKELAAHAIHRLSNRARRTFVSRSAATFPDTLIDAELFGNVGNYPNPGMRDRPGLIGEADGSTLFLDEIGELPAQMQARLLRVLDSGGEYSRLGEARNRRADFRLIAATNRSTDELKQDFAARFTLRLAIPDLNMRREDIPLIIRHLLARAARSNADVAQRYYDPTDEQFARPRIAPQLVDRLVRHQYRLHVRELDTLLWQAMISSPLGFIGLTPDVEAELEPQEGSDSHLAPTEIDAATVESSLARNDGNVTRAARELGLKNRYVLYRLMSKFGLR